MTETTTQEDGVSRREFMVAAGTAAVVSGAFAASGTPVCAGHLGKRNLAPHGCDDARRENSHQANFWAGTEVTEAVLARGWTGSIP